MDIDRDKLYQLYITENKTTKQLMEHFNCSKYAIKTNLKKHNIRKSIEQRTLNSSKSKKNKNIIHSLTKEWFVDNYINQNLRVNDIADKLKVSIYCVERKLKELGIKKSQKLAKKLSVETNLKKYGTANPMQNTEIKEKSQQTILKKYGKHHTKLKEVQDKKGKTNLQRYNAECVTQNKEIMKKIQQTNLKKYGNICSLHGEETRKKVIETFNEKYHGNNPMCDENIKKKITITNLSKYGCKYPLQNKAIKDKMIDTKIKNGSIILIKDLSIEQLSQKYNVPYSSIVQFINKTQRTQEEIMDYLVNYGGRLNSLEKSTQNILNIDFFNQNPNSELNCKPDFKLTDKIYLNVDGLYWHSELVKNNNRYHYNMRKQYEDNDLQIVQIRENEIYQKPEIIQSIINNKLNRNVTTIYARKCEVKKVDSKTANDFLNKCHLKGSFKGKHFGLYYNNVLTTIITYKVYKNTILKVERFCTELNTRVIGGFSKLLKYLENQINFNEIHYWVDLKYGTGYFLLNLGFKHSHDTLGWEWTDFVDTYNRRKCRANMDDRKLREREYANELGWHKIYDAGQRLYKKVK